MASTNNRSCITSAYAPEWLQHVAPDGALPDNVEFDVPCVICREQLAGSTTDNTTHPFAVLPCGHIFGAECIHFIIDEGEKPKCPLCFKPIQNCSHPIELRCFKFCREPALFLEIRHVVSAKGKCTHCQTIYSSKDIRDILDTIPDYSSDGDLDYALTSIKYWFPKESQANRRQIERWRARMHYGHRETIANFLFLLGIDKGKPTGKRRFPYPDWYLEVPADVEESERFAELVLGCSLDIHDDQLIFREKASEFVARHLKDYAPNGYPFVFY